MTADNTGEPVSLVVGYLFAGRVSGAEEFRIFYCENRLQLTRQSTVTDGGCKGNEPCTSYSRTFTIHKYGYGKLRTSSRTT